ncbi:MAG: restriction endonuclease, partial [Pseudomonadota bacterium]|nr:restriction endonuclease [Pseudomonadota bacterium]
MTFNLKKKFSSCWGYALFGIISFTIIYSFFSVRVPQTLIYSISLFLVCGLVIGISAEIIKAIQSSRRTPLTTENKIWFISFVLYFSLLWVGIYNFSHRTTVAGAFGNALIVTFMGGWILAGILFAILHTKLENFFEARIPCPHGVTGGKTRNLCSKCKHEKIIAEEEYRKRMEAEQQARDLRNAAAELRNNEAARLAKSIVLSLEELRHLSPQQFEDEIAKMFERLGYKVEQTPYTNDYGRDAILTKGDEKAIVECKRYGEKQTSGRPDLQKFYAAIMDDKAQKGFFVTSGEF